MSAMLLPLSIGVVAGLRAMLAPAVVSWGARLGWLDLSGTPLGFLADGWTCTLLTVLTVAELVADQLPSTPSRTRAVPFATRVVSGATSGGAVGAAMGSVAAGLVAGAVGAVVGTLGGHAARARLADAFGADRPAALVEDAVAIVSAVLIVVASGR